VEKKAFAGLIRNCLLTLRKIERRNLSFVYKVYLAYTLPLLTMHQVTSTILSMLMFCMGLSAQCTLVSTAVQDPINSCSPGQSIFFGYASGNCPSAIQYAYTWEAYSLSPTGNPLLLQTFNGTSPSPTSILPFQYTGFDLGSVCFIIQALDAENNVIGLDTTCLNNILLSPPMSVITSVDPNICGDQACATFTTVGGAPPYTYFVNGSSPSNNGFFCFSEPGTYVGTVNDAMGCVLDFMITIPAFDPSNNSCEHATVLENGIAQTDTLCGATFPTSECSGQNFIQEGWYTFYSGENTILQAGFASDLPGTISSMPGALELYSSSGDCSNLTFVQCIAIDSCLATATPVTLVPNTVYYIRYLSMWTSFALVDAIIVLGQNPVEGICGCNQPTSCNYDPGSLINDGSCGWNGCTDPQACNYMQWATCDDGSCLYGSDITGLVFHDVNGNGIRDTWPILEMGLGGIGALTVEELNIEIIPNAAGQFVLPALPIGTYTITFDDTSGMWSAVNDSLSIVLPTCNGLLFALQPSNGASVNFSGNLNTWGFNIHCTNGVNAGAWIQNTGAVPITGTAQIQFDPLFQILPTSGYTYTSASPGEVIFNISLAPGEGHYYSFFIAGPGVDYVGDYFDFTTQAQFEVNGVPFYSQSFEAQAWVTCAYDPNDKQALPAGFTDEHYIAPDTDLEYRIRFQNTGNAPAFDVVIVDSLDVTHLDLSTFQSIGASHSYSTIVEPDGVVRFVFNNIMLPDSGSDFEGSQGYVLFRIRTRPDLLHFDIIENNAAIYFDQNPPIITNTYLHTIFDCNSLQALPASGEVCNGLDYVLELAPEWVNSYTWLTDGDVIGQESYLVLDENTPGNVEVILIRENDLCYKTDTLLVDVLPVPSTDLTYANGWLTASEGDLFSWYFNGEPLPNATTQQIEVTLPGVYQVVVSFDTGCNTTSVPVTVVSTPESMEAALLLWPQPAHDFIQLQLPEGTWNLALYSALGQCISNHQLMRGLFRTDISHLAPGVYVWRLQEAQGSSFSLPMIKK
jgi:hypothetical protein